MAAYFRRFMDEIVKPLVDGGSLRQDGAAWVLDGALDPDQVRAITEASQNFTAGMDHAPRGMLFVAAQPAIFAAVGEHLLGGKIPIHGVQDFDVTRPIQAGERFRLRVQPKVRRNAAFLDLTFTDDDGSVFATGKTVLSFQSDFSGVQPKSAERATIGELILSEWITAGVIDAYATASGDRNIVHVDDAGAQQLGLPSRILHGMRTDHIAQRAAHHGTLPTGPLDVGSSRTEFTGVVSPGDELSAYRLETADGPVVSIINQRGELVLVRRPK